MPIGEPARNPSASAGRGIASPNPGRSHGRSLPPREGPARSGAAPGPPGGSEPGSDVRPGLPGEGLPRDGAARADVAYRRAAVSGGDVPRGAPGGGPPGDRTAGNGVPDRRIAASGPASAPVGAAWPLPLLPDLTGVRLGGLRALDDPYLTAAADSALRHPDELAETWYSSGAQGGRREAAGGAGPGRGPADGRETAGGRRVVAGHRREAVDGPREVPGGSRP
ncbi:hypothetical protein I5Q34_04775 [Streptomyces sp. AV19]|uniref:hypothetical protein n=1 Tax=Streptomyces sp. AV19 TaxID=2793068 RepID=UPI0018FE449B|nr:hypothetical protein [Streptomyces sp. AV19]MBH1933612.1 hypothetical protein [Streptomyces sp. AV19]MDG4535882.1 hypothetical protein [Streptomyces sp. AV19]